MSFELRHLISLVLQRAVVRKRLHTWQAPPRTLRKAEAVAVGLQAKTVEETERTGSTERIVMDCSEFFICNYKESLNLWELNLFKGLTFECFSQHVERLMVQH